MQVGSGCKTVNLPTPVVGHRALGLGNPWGCLGPPWEAILDTPLLQISIPPPSISMQHASLQSNQDPSSQQSLRLALLKQQKCLGCRFRKRPDMRLTLAMAGVTKFFVAGGGHAFTPTRPHMHTNTHTHTQR